MVHFCFCVGSYGSMDFGETMENNRYNFHPCVDRRPHARVRFRVQVGHDTFY